GSTPHGGARRRELHAHRQELAGRAHFRGGRPRMARLADRVEPERFPRPRLLRLTEMVDDHFRHGFPRADGSTKPHESPLSLWERGGGEGNDGEGRGGGWW